VAAAAGGVLVLAGAAVWLALRPAAAPEAPPTPPAAAPVAAAVRPPVLEGWYRGADEPLPPAPCQVSPPAAGALAAAVAQARAPAQGLAELSAGGRALASAEERFVEASLRLGAGGGAREAAETAAGCAGFAAAQNLAGKVALQEGRAEDALRWFSAAEASAPGYFKPRFNRALALLKAGKAPDAAPLLEALATEAPNRGEVHFALGHARTALGQVDSAKAAFCRAHGLGVADAAAGCGIP
jgi:hypothetical protein